MPMMIDAIRDGMAKDHASRAMQVLGELLTEWLLKHPEHAGRDAGEKTLAGAMAAIREVAKKQGGGMGIVDDQEGLRIALGYLGVDPGAAAADPAGTPPPMAEDLDDALNIDKLLGL